MSEQTDREWMRNRLDTIADGMTDLKLAVAEIKGTCPSCGESLHDLKAAVFGNGKEGLKTRVDRLERDDNTRWRWLLRASILVGWLVTSGCLIYSTFGI